MTAEGIYEMGFVKPSKVQAVSSAGGKVRFCQGRPIEDLEGCPFFPTLVDLSGRSIRFLFCKLATDFV